MELAPDTVRHWLDLAFSRMDAVLDRLDDDSVNRRPDGWGTNSVAGLVVHCCELAPWWFEVPGLGRDADRDRDAEFAASATIDELRRRIATSRERCAVLVDEFDAGPTATGHAFRGFLAGGDTSDASLVVHVFEELFQHVGHMDVTADALTG